MYGHQDSHDNATLQQQKFGTNISSQFLLFSVDIDIVFASPFGDGDPTVACVVPFSYGSPEQVRSALLKTDPKLGDAPGSLAQDLIVIRREGK